MKKIVYAALAAIGVFVVLIFIVQLSGEMESSMSNEKPVIYLYPEQEEEVSVRLDYDGKLTCTYPEYDDGWHVTAAPDGRITDENGQEYNYLYWEGETEQEYDFSEGFCVQERIRQSSLKTPLRSLVSHAGKQMNSLYTGCPEWNRMSTTSFLSRAKHIRTMPAFPYSRSRTP